MVRSFKISILVVLLTTFIPTIAKREIAEGDSEDESYDQLHVFKESLRNKTLGVQKMMQRIKTHGISSLLHKDASLAGVDSEEIEEDAHHETTVVPDPPSEPSLDEGEPLHKDASLAGADSEEIEEDADHETTVVPDPPSAPSLDEGKPLHQDADVVSPTSATQPMNEEASHEILPHVVPGLADAVPDMSLLANVTQVDDKVEGAYPCADERGTCQCTGTIFYGKKFWQGIPGQGAPIPFESLGQGCQYDANVGLVGSNCLQRFQWDANHGTHGNCNNNARGDPAPGYTKQCFCNPAVKCADEHGQCNCFGTVVYGRLFDEQCQGTVVNGQCQGTVVKGQPMQFATLKQRWRPQGPHGPIQRKYQTFSWPSHGPTMCNNQVKGDPAYGHKKQCFCQGR